MEGECEERERWWTREVCAVHAKNNEYITEG